MHVEAYVYFKGNCEQAFEFYKAALGGELSLNRYEGTPRESHVSAADKSKILHASLRFESGAAIMGADAVGEWKHTVGNNIALSLATNDESEAKRSFEKLAAGGKVEMPLAPTFWGAKLFGMLVDKFGVQWLISCH